MRPARVLAFGVLAVLFGAGWLMSRRTVYDTLPPAFDSTGSAPRPPMLEFKRAFVKLDSALTEAERDSLRRTLPEAGWRYHLSVGLLIRNEILRPAAGGEPLVRYFIARDLRSMDDMSSVLLDLYGQYLRDQPLDVDAAIRRVPAAPRPAVDSTTAG